MAIATFDAIVLGCDSLSSRTTQAVLPFTNGAGFAMDADGKEMVDAYGNKVVSTAHLQTVVTDVFTGARKMFLLYEDDDCTVAAVTAGLAVLNGLTIAGTVARFRREAAAQQSFRTVEEVVKAFKEYVRSEWEHFVKLDSIPSERVPYLPDLQFIIGGYSLDEISGAVYKVSIRNNSAEAQFGWETKSGACFAGQADYVERLLTGVDSRFFDTLCQRADEQILSARRAGANEVLKQLETAKVAVPEGMQVELPEAWFDPGPFDSYAQIDFANLPTQYAVELVELLVNLQSGMQRFQMGVATVGGRSHVGVIRRGEKFRMLNEPDLVHSHTGYNHDL